MSNEIATNWGEHSASAQTFRKKEQLVNKFYSCSLVIVRRGRPRKCDTMCQQNRAVCYNMYNNWQLLRANNEHIGNLLFLICIVADSSALFNPSFPIGHY